LRFDLIARDAVEETIANVAAEETAAAPISGRRDINLRKRWTRMRRKRELGRRQRTGGSYQADSVSLKGINIKTQRLVHLPIDQVIEIVLVIEDHLGSTWQRKKRSGREEEKEKEGNIPTM